MPKGPKGEKRPRDVVGAAVKVARIATGEEKEETKSKEESAATILGKRGGKARARRLTPEQRHKIAKLAAEARWKKSKN